MTYNFDSDRWFEIQTARLADRLERGELDESEYRAALSDLERRREEMERRLEGSYQIPGSDAGS